MKIFCVINNYRSPLTITSAADEGRDFADAPVEWYMLPDSTLVRNNNPMFVPDFDEEFVAFPSLVVRIDKLGKNIAGKFSSRYYSSVAPGLSIQAIGLMKRLKNEGLPWSRAVIFDRSCMLGDFMEIRNENPRNCEDVTPDTYDNGFTIDFEGDGKSLRWRDESLIKDIDRVVSDLSRENTLKIGDLIYVALMPEGFTLKIGDEIRGVLNGEELLKIRLR